jgi:hypothetical protein
MALWGLQCFGKKEKMGAKSLGLVPRRSIFSWYNVGIALLVVKAVTVVMSLRGACNSHTCGAWVWLLGKMVPTAICFCLYNDALAHQKGTRRFWLWALLVVPLLSILLMTDLYKRLF